MMPKKNKILVYVEGESEEILFKEYLNPYIKNTYGIVLECQKGDIPSFKRKVKDFYSDYKEIFVLRDLKTQLTGIQDYPCITKMKQDYTTRNEKRFLGNIGRSYKFIVVCTEIESWLLTHRKNTNNRSEKHIQELFKEFGCNKKPPCVKKFVDKLKRGTIGSPDITRNKSFQYFIDELVKCK